MSSKKIFFFLFCFLILFFVVSIETQRATSFAETRRIASFVETQDFASLQAIAINDNGLEFSFEKFSSSTVEEILKQTKLNIDFSSDEIYPSLSEKSFSKIIIKRKTSFKIIYDGKEIQDKTFEKTISEVLDEKEIKLGERDKIFPKKEERIFSGIEIKIIRVEEKIIKEKKKISFKTEYQEDSSLFKGESKIFQEGENGEEELEYLIILEDEKEVKRILKDKKVSASPKNKIILKGTKISPDLPIGQAGDFQEGIASWYNLDGYKAASTKFKRGMKLRVTNLSNNQSVEVIVRDVGPELWTGCIIDLSNQAFKQIAPLKVGRIKVRVEKIY